MNTLTRPHSDEVFPVRATLRTSKTLNQFQGALLTCTHVGGITAVELMDPEGRNYSPRYVWYFKPPNTMSIEGFVANLNRTGTCLDELCPYLVDTEWPYAVHDIDVSPSAAAILDANARGVKGFELEGVTSQWDFMRAICHTQSMMLCKVIAPGVEHVFAGSGYDFVQGMEIIDNGYANVSEFYPWFNFGPVITQIRRFSKSPWPFTVHPDYRPSTPATFEAGVLSAKFLTIKPKPGLKNWQDPFQYFKNVVVHFGSHLNPENTTINDPEVVGHDITWKPASEDYGTPDTLHIPRVLVGGLLLERVSIKGVVPTIVSYEKDES